MLFNTHIFIFAFLPFSFFVYFLLNKAKKTILAKIFLLFSSLFFYAWWNYNYLPLILFSMAFNFYLGQKLKNKNKKLLYFGVFVNLALLGFFKYTNFMIENLNFALNLNINTLNLVLPLAISFFTFQQIAYLVDSYKFEIKEQSFLNYGIFVCFFPQLIAGPIVHHKEMMSQFESSRNKIINYKNIALGIFIFSIGLFKKAVIADTFAKWADFGFDEAGPISFFEAWATSLSYTFQLYFDFSGYTDMAIGAALLFNIKLPLNFNSPYKALDLQDFWRRWHMTLSRFLRDYIYIPLGGNKINIKRTYINLMATFLLGGIWHGAGWTFIIWGLMHGIGVCVHRAWQKTGIKMHKILAWFITFNFVNIAWVFFRATSFDDAWRILNAMFMPGRIGMPVEMAEFLNYINPLKEFVLITGDKTIISYVNIYTFEMLILAFIITLGFRNTNSYIRNFSYDVKYAIFSVFSIICFYFIGLVYEESAFLYFNF